ncbi:glycosyltransferase [Chitinophaga sancti]|uniref:glycosyltransferase n=1 Tax=Chitinophaga sancti TaxID=1004 RepID=UPI003F79A0B2
MMDFSVLMSVYRNDDVEALRASVESLLKQERRPSEIVIVLDGPVPEDITKLLNSYKEQYSPLFNLVPLPVNVGLGKALSIGLEHCNYELIARMDADDISKPARFAKQVGFMERHQEVDLVGSWIEEFIGVTDNVVSLRKVPETYEEIVKFAKVRSPFNHPTVVFRKEAIREVGGYHDYGTFEDYHLWSRLIVNNKKCHNLQEGLLFFRTTRNLYKRRGGWKKAVAEWKLQCYFLSIGFISRTQFLRNVASRGLARLVPNFVRAMLYKVVLSSKKV